MKMPRKRRPSDDLTNARKRATRLATRLEKGGNMREAQALRNLVAGTYQKAGAHVSTQQLDAATVGMRNLMQPGTAQRQRSQPGGAQTQVQPQAQVRTPRPKRPSDEVYNARRRLKRAAERLLRKSQAEPDDTAGKVLKGYAQYLLQQAKPTGKLNAEERQGALERLGRLREKVGKDIEGGFRVQRRNSILMQQLNAAGTEGADSAISERQKDVFWAATKGLWPSGSNVPRNERYDKILEHFYSDDTTDAKDFRAWLEEKKGTNAQDSFGDLQLVYEYVTEEMNDPALYDDPELPYETAMQYVITAM
jgi:hypothetical protein